MPCFLGLTRPSEIDCDRGSCIDNVFIKNDSMHSGTYKLLELFNDHYALFLNLNVGMNAFTIQACC